MVPAGTTQTVACSWGCGRMVVEVWRRYPPSAGIAAVGYWDCSACPCGDLHAIGSGGDGRRLKMGRSDGDSGRRAGGRISVAVKLRG